MNYYINLLFDYIVFGKIYLEESNGGLYMNKKIISIGILLLILIMSGNSCSKKAALTNDTTSSDSISSDSILIKNHSLLDTTPFYNVSMEQIEETGKEEFDITFSEERSNGRFTYYTGNGIIYISINDKDIYSILLTDNTYELNCGIKVGMKEDEISSLELPFDEYSKDEIGVDKKISSFLLNCKIGPVSMLDFDTLYQYNATLTSDNQNDNYDGSCIGLLAFVKDGKVIAVSTDWPNAN